MLTEEALYAPPAGILAIISTISLFVDDEAKATPPPETATTSVKTAKTQHR
jgi:hypothetical protein